MSDQNKVTRKDTVISLPSIPKDKDYEDAIAAYLQVVGYYLERSVTKQENNRDILELDIVVNNFMDGVNGKALLEVKSGGTGIKDLFKVRGWMDYLDLKKACLVSQKSPDTGADAVEIVARKLGIEFILDEKVHYSSIQSRFPGILTADNSSFLNIVRWSFLIERIMCSHITRAKKDNKDNEGFSALDKYCRIVSNYSFFCNGPLDRLHTIISAFNDNRNITAKISGSFITGAYVKDSVPQLSRTEFDRLFYYNDKPDILYSSLWVEYMTRIAVISAVIEHIVNPVIPQNQFEEFISQLSRSSLPFNISDAITELSRHPHVARYPHFWQIFTYVMGGFIDEDNKEEEYRLLSRLTDIPVSGIDSALSSFDTVFPQQSGKSWLYTNSKSKIAGISFFPPPLQGIGVEMRFHHLCNNDSDTFRKKYDIGYLPYGSQCSCKYRDMSRWHRLAFNYLCTVAT